MTLDLFVACIQLALIIKRGMKKLPPPLLGQSHSESMKCMANKKGEKKQNRDDTFGTPAGTTDKFYDVLIALAVTVVCRGRKNCQNSSSTNLIGRVQGQVWCTKLSALFVIILLLRSGDVETNPGPVDRGRWLCLIDS